jgi:hypothetical protein
LIWQIAGLDISELAIEKLKKILPGGKFVCGSIYDAAKLLEPAELVFTCGVLIHIPPEGMKKAAENINALSEYSIHLEA